MQFIVEKHGRHKTHEAKTGQRSLQMRRACNAKLLQGGAKQRAIRSSPSREGKRKRQEEFSDEEKSSDEEKLSSEEESSDKD